MCSHSTPVSIYLGEMKIPNAYKGNKTKMTHGECQKRFDGSKRVLNLLFGTQVYAKK